MTFAGLSHLCSQLTSGMGTSNGAGTWACTWTANSRSRLDKSLDSLGAVVERRMWCMLLDILDNANHPLHHTLVGQSSGPSHCARGLSATGGALSSQPLDCVTTYLGAGAPDQGLCDLTSCPRPLPCRNTWLHSLTQGRGGRLTNSPICAKNSRNLDYRTLY